MDSSSKRREEEERKQADLRRQIALLQSQLKEPLPDTHPEPPVTPRKRKHATLLAPATPSPKKQKVVKETKKHDARNLKARPVRPPPPNKTVNTRHAPNGAEPSIQPGASTVLSKLASFTSVSTDNATKHCVIRSVGFTEKAAPPPTRDANDAVITGNKRDDDLALVEDLEPGPYDHAAPFDDPHFQKLEPNSGIRLSSRTIPYDDFHDYLRGRYYLSPSKLYSVVRLLPNKQGYDVPVEGDWVTIAVVAERGPIKYSRAPVGIGKDEQAALPEEDDIKSLALDQPPKPARPEYANHWKGKTKAKDGPAKPSGKKYMNLKLIDFGCRTTQSSASGGKKTIRGDAFLTLLLFESDRVEMVVRDDGKKEKVYRGGSKGAFERMSKLKEGAVVALLNPKILRPFQRAGDTPHPTDNVLALTPDSVESIAVVGHSQDLGMCSVVKRDGKVCGGWCDKRVSDVCEWHVQHAVERKRAGRAEFSMGTSGMASGAKKKPAYDPTRQWGLKPELDSGGGSGGATYVVSGHIVSGGPADPRSLFIAESMGRDAQAKAARKASSKEADQVLEKLLQRDKEGMKAVEAARAYAAKMKRDEKAGKAQKKGKGKEKDGDPDAGLDEEEGYEEKERMAKNPYSTSLIRNLGFDPSAKDGRKIKDSDVQKKLQELASLQASRKEITLGPRPGKLKSNVRPPDHPPPPPLAPSAPVASSESENLEGRGRSYPMTESDEDEPLHIPDSDDDDDGIGAQEREAFGHELARQSARSADLKMVDLDSSDGELEVEPP
ncbi:hypothetical protein PHLCEN_2v8376 [Hermanssonia centrifuga]|uniref:Zinc finger Mcm10/DnaG-type domain-containing protein n=1 Tax=Hermanssonia centrifuga TaxID=98765 RepID=A0A2R6NUM2_9APHY|nr:hypothetical protein PHLCEN_2v8376 [Hermanssonia centrifuga]